MRPNDRNVSETLARLVEEQLVAATWRLELRLYMLLAAAFCASLAAHLFMLGQLQLKLHLFKLDRAQREQRRARRRLQSAKPAGRPEHQDTQHARAHRLSVQREVHAGTLSQDTSESLGSHG